MLTVNTSPVSQAVIGGILIESKFSLKAANKQKIDFYRQNLRGLLAALAEHMPAGVTWNTPAGGFFAVAKVPLVADEKLLEISASDYGVLWTPMSFFYTGGEGSHSLRLSCSYLDRAQIEEGVRRLARLIGDKQ
jgi:(S)-3,5-dihydroxyphenylglycine transaminase